MARTRSLHQAELRLLDRFTSVLKRVESTTKAATSRIAGSFRRAAKSVVGMAAAYLGIRAAARTLGVAISLSENAEKVNKSLDLILGSLGLNVRASSKFIKDWAANLEAATATSDELFKSAAASLAGLAETTNLDLVTRSVQALADMAAGLGIKFERARNTFFAFVSGGSETISRLGLEVDTTANSIERMESFIDAVNRKGFAGAAEESATQINKLNTSWENLLEASGDFVKGSPTVQAVIQADTDVINRLTAALNKAVAVRGKVGFEDLGLPDPAATGTVVASIIQDLSALTDQLAQPVSSSQLAGIKSRLEGLRDVTDAFAARLSKSLSNADSEQAGLLRSSLKSIEALGGVQGAAATAMLNLAGLAVSSIDEANATAVKSSRDAVEKITGLITEALGSIESGKIVPVSAEAARHAEELSAALRGLSGPEKAFGNALNFVSGIASKAAPVLGAVVEAQGKIARQQQIQTLASDFVSSFQAAGKQVDLLGQDLIDFAVQNGIAAEEVTALITAIDGLSKVKGPETLEQSVARVQDKLRRTDTIDALAAAYVEGFSSAGRQVDLLSTDLLDFAAVNGIAADEVDALVSRIRSLASTPTQSFDFEINIRDPRQSAESLAQGFAFDLGPELFNAASIQDFFSSTAQRFGEALGQAALVHLTEPLSDAISQILVAPALGLLGKIGTAGGELVLEAAESTGLLHSGAALAGSEVALGGTESAAAQVAGGTEAGFAVAGGGTEAAAALAAGGASGGTAAAAGGSEAGLAMSAGGTEAGLATASGGSLAAGFLASGAAAASALLAAGGAIAAALLELGATIAAAILATGIVGAIVAAIVLAVLAVVFRKKVKGFFRGLGFAEGGVVPEPSPAAAITGQGTDRTLIAATPGEIVIPRDRSREIIAGGGLPALLGRSAQPAARQDSTGIVGEIPALAAGGLVGLTGRFRRGIDLLAPAGRDLSLGGILGPSGAHPASPGARIPLAGAELPSTRIPGIMRDLVVGPESGPLTGLRGPLLGPDEADVVFGRPGPRIPVDQDTPSRGRAGAPAQLQDGSTAAGERVVFVQHVQRQLFSDPGDIDLFARKVSQALGRLALAGGA